jgi:hypothetical protein
LPDDAPPARTYRGSDGNLFLARCRSRQKKICKIGASDQKHKPYCAEQNPQNAPAVDRSQLVQWHETRSNLETPTRMSGIEAPGERFSLSLGLGEGDARLQSRNTAEERVPAIGWVNLGGSQYIGGVKEPEVRRHHSNDGVVLCVESERLTDDFRIRIEVTPPEALADDYNLALARLILLDGKSSAPRRRYTEHGKKARADRKRGDNHRAIAT